MENIPGICDKAVDQRALSKLADILDVKSAKRLVREAFQPRRIDEAKISNIEYETRSNAYEFNFQLLRTCSEKYPENMTCGFLYQALSNIECSQETRAKFKNAVHSTDVPPNITQNQDERDASSVVQCDIHDLSLDMCSCSTVKSTSRAQTELIRPGYAQKDNSVSTLAQPSSEPENTEPTYHQGGSTEEYSTSSSASFETIVSSHPSHATILPLVRSPDRRAPSTSTVHDVRQFSTKPSLRNSQFMVLVPELKENQPEYVLTRSLLNEIRTLNANIMLCLSVRKAELASTDLAWLTAQDVEIIEPNFSDVEEETNNPKVLLAEYYQECYRHLLKHVPKCCCMIAVGFDMARLATHLKMFGDVDNTCKLIMTFTAPENIGVQPSWGFQYTIIKAMRLCHKVVDVKEDKSLSELWGLHQMEDTLKERMVTWYTKTDYNREWKQVLGTLNSSPRTDLYDVSSLGTSRQPLGIGPFGGVFSMGTEAVKEIALGGIDEAFNRSAVFKDIDVIKELQSKQRCLNIVPIHGYSFEKGRRLQIVMQQASISMFDLLEKKEYSQMEFKQKKDIACQICNGLAYMHERFLVHENLNPGNILFTDERVPMLSDFGLFHVKTLLLQHSTLETTGSPFYDAPEGDSVPPSSDVWSASLILLHWLTGQKPWKSENPSTAGEIMKVKMANILPLDELRVLDKLDKAAAIVIGEGLNFEPSARPSAREIQRRLV